MDDLQEIVQEFLVESYENLDRLDLELVALEQNPSDLGRLSSVFRTIHTIKGSCSFLGFSRLEKLTHAGENLLSQLREGHLMLTQQRASALLKLVDAVREFLGRIEADGDEGTRDYAELEEELGRLCEDSPEQQLAEPAPAHPRSASSSRRIEATVGAASPPGAGPVAAVPAEPSWPAALHPEPSSGDPDEIQWPALPASAELPDPFSAVSSEPGGASAAAPASKGTGMKPATPPSAVPASAPNRATDIVIVQGDHQDQHSEPEGLLDNPERFGEILIKEGRASSVDVLNARILQDQGDPRRLGEILIEMGAIKPADVTDLLKREPRVKSPAEMKFGDMLLAQGKATAEDISFAASIQQSGDSRRLGEILVEMGVLRPQDVSDVLQRQAEVRSRVTDSSTRVEVALLDQLMNLVGELVLARNQIQQVAMVQQDASLQIASQRLSFITSALQSGVMKTRMQPISAIWSKFPRMVRDLAMGCDKRVRLEMVGEDTELDKAVIEALRDPLTHTVRNSIDHGIELPAQREQAGKRPEGLLKLRAFHEGGQVVVEIRDDGAGIDPEKLRAKAIERKLRTVEQLSQVSPQELLKLIFLPGFSTKEQVTHLSGRGVGMDVVKTNIERIGGTLDLQSKVGQGTTLSIRIPLTLAIIPALVVKCHGERFVIPQVNLLELVRRSQGDGESRVEQVLGREVFRLRGTLIPLVGLTRLLKMDPEEAAAGRFESSDDQKIVVLQSGQLCFGLVVDAVLDTQEVVVKPLAASLKHLKVFSGATIMGDGKVALILDVQGVSAEARLSSRHARKDPAQDQAADSHRAQGIQSLLVFDGGSQGRMAFPLSKVARLEELELSSVEHVEGRLVAQHRGEILPLIEVERVLGERRRRPRGDAEGSAQQRTGRVPVVVYRSGDQNVGLMVRRIVDVVEEQLVGSRPGTRKGVSSTAILLGKVTQLLDIDEVIALAERGSSAEKPQARRPA